MDSPSKATVYTLIEITIVWVPLVVQNGQYVTDLQGTAFQDGLSSYVCSCEYHIVLNKCDAYLVSSMLPIIPWQGFQIVLLGRHVWGSEITELCLGLADHGTNEQMMCLSTIQISPLRPKSA